jgi:hypothetical protein
LSTKFVKPPPPGLALHPHTKMKSK